MRLTPVDVLSQPILKNAVSEWQITDERNPWYRRKKQYVMKENSPDETAEYLERMHFNTYQ